MQKLSYLREVLSKYNLKGTSILDAGTGKGSAQLLIDFKPRALCCVTNEGDIRKGRSVEEIIKGTGNKEYRLIYGDLAHRGLFATEQFDCILADYLLGEMEVGKVNTVLGNLHTWLKPKGKLLLIDRELYEGAKVKIEYISMGEIKGDANLHERSEEELVRLAELFMALPKEFLLLHPAQRSFDYPSSWVGSWLNDAGFTNIKRNHFESEQNTKQEFTGRMEWARQRIEGLNNPELKAGLLKEMERVRAEFEKRKIADETTFSRVQFCFEAQK